MLGGDGFGLDFAIIECLFGEYQFFDILIVHDDELHDLP